MRSASAVKDIYHIPPLKRYSCPQGLLARCQKCQHLALFSGDVGTYVGLISGLIWKTKPCSCASQPATSRFKTFFLFLQIASRCSAPHFFLLLTPITSLFSHSSSCVCVCYWIEYYFCPNKGIIKTLTWSHTTRK